MGERISAYEIHALFQTGTDGPAYGGVGEKRMRSSVCFFVSITQARNLSECCVCK